jgi:hypothetical protein
VVRPPVSGPKCPSRVRIIRQDFVVLEAGHDPFAILERPVLGASRIREERNIARGGDDGTPQTIAPR